MCDPLIGVLSREGFKVYHRDGGKDVLNVQLLRDAPSMLGEVEAVDIQVRRRDRGYILNMQLAVFGRDIVRALPGRLDIVENAVSDMARSSVLSRNTVGILGMGALNAYQLQRRLFRCLEDMLSPAVP